jgi:hypothetical protein
VGAFRSLILWQVPGSDRYEIRGDCSPGMHNRILLTLSIVQTPHAVGPKTFVKRWLDRTAIYEPIRHLVIFLRRGRPKLKPVFVEVFFEILTIERIKRHRSSSYTGH